MIESYSTVIESANLFHSLDAVFPDVCETRINIGIKQIENVFLKERKGEWMWMCVWVCMREWVSEWVSEWVYEWVSKWVSEWECVCVWVRWVSWVNSVRERVELRFLTLSHPSVFQWTAQMWPWWQQLCSRNLYHTLLCRLTRYETYHKYSE